MEPERPHYLSYLLRLWRNDGELKTAWRASLDSSLTGKRRSFASLDDLLAFLRRQTGAGCEADGDERAAGEQSEDISGRHRHENSTDHPLVKRGP
jgi:hypothetical protein